MMITQLASTTGYFFLATCLGLDPVPFVMKLLCSMAPPNPQRSDVDQYNKSDDGYPYAARWYGFVIRVKW